MWGNGRWFLLIEGCPEISEWVDLPDRPAKFGLGLAERGLEALTEGEGLLSRRIVNIRIILWYGSGGLKPTPVHAPVSEVKGSLRV